MPVPVNPRVKSTWADGLIAVIAFLIPVYGLTSFACPAAPCVLE